ncbi:MAG: lytic murein transglycosylase B [Gallionella sp.]|jgi:membrane-bound lytic murein transglycosylase B
MKLFTTCILALTGALVLTPAYPASLPGIPEFIDEMVVKHQFKRDELTALFEHANHRPRIIEAISRPATIKPWLEYRAAFVNENRIKPGLLFWKKYRIALQRAEKKYGVPQEIIVSLIGVETLYGQNMGDFRILDALTTLAFDYPRRATFFRDELENYLLLSREQQFDLLGVRGSYAGAMGIPQFMPSSYRKYAVDFNGNHKTDLLNEPADAIGSVGNYLQGYGWIKGGLIASHAEIAGEIPTVSTQRSLAEWAQLGVRAKVRRDEPARLLNFTVEQGKAYWLGFNNFDVITRYNNSDFYAMSVFELAEALKAAHNIKPRAKKHK